MRGGGAARPLLLPVRQLRRPCPQANLQCLEEGPPDSRSTPDSQTALIVFFFTCKRTAGELFDDVSVPGGGSLHNSREDLCEAGLDDGGVELRSVRTGLGEEGLSALYSSVIKSGRRGDVRAGEDDGARQAGHDRAPLSLAKVCWDHRTSPPPSHLYPVPQKPLNLEMPFSKTVLRDSVILAQVALGKLGTGSTTVVAKDLTELSDLLASTNHVLQRNSHLRASLTISVKKPSLSRSGSTVAKTTSTPKNVRKTPAKSKPAKDKAQKNIVKDKVSEAIILCLVRQGTHHYRVT